MLLSPLFPTAPRNRSVSLAHSLIPSTTSTPPASPGTAVFRRAVAQLAAAATPRVCSNSSASRCGTGAVPARPARAVCR
ncbi:uncharacterized protein BDZ99DRAFT_466954 [Mytilinidion resinicola]|uniref:Uncharacterized protein n=1 Tax=Mytilinidion resinicola TaxID=574789 RepID=A0A6A6Y9F1_9PEZI|nr:uncharacterized protein BDZ99DRAFT_466954 [Mytilinidion resinicola]KAF2805320.1 hypothetical protein BDZ99DRAFT_466954 [Mytilinidion resinicola]